VIFDKLHYTAFRGSSLGETILGPEANIKSMTASDIKEYVDTHYTGPRMVISGAGAITHEQMHSLGEKLFAGIPSVPRNGAKVRRPRSEFTGSDYRQREDGMTYAHFALAYETCGHNDPDTMTLFVLQGMLGQWNRANANTNGAFSSSRLVSAVSDRDLATSIQTFNTQYNDTGLFGVYAVGEPVGLDHLEIAISREMVRLCYNVDPELLEEVKNQVWQTMLSHLDGSTPISEDIGRQILNYGRRLHPTEVYARLQAVDTDAVKAAANRFFYDRDHAMAAIGPIWELMDYNDVRRRSYLLRY